MSRKIQSFTICFILILFAYLYCTADYSKYTPGSEYFWDNFWYVSEALLFSLWALCCWKMCDYIDLSRAWFVLFLFLIIRTLWEISAVIAGVSVNEKIAMFVLYLIAAIMILIIMFLPIILKRWQK